MKPLDKVLFKKYPSISVAFCRILQRYLCALSINDGPNKLNLKNKADETNTKYTLKHVLFGLFFCDQTKTNFIASFKAVFLWSKTFKVKNNNNKSGNSRKIQECFLIILLAFTGNRHPMFRLFIINVTALTSNLRKFESLKSGADDRKYQFPPFS